MHKLTRCIRTNVGTAEDPVYTLGTEDGSPAPSSVIAPEDPPALDAGGIAELWYWDADPNPAPVVAA